MTIENESKVRNHYRICSFCEQHCGIVVDVDHATGNVLTVRGDKDDPLSQGYICPKAYAMKDLHEDPDVLKQPMIRRDGQLLPVSWDEALDFAAERIRDLQKQYGKDSLAFFPGNSAAHVPSLMLYTPVLADALGTKQVYTSASVDTNPHLLVAMAMFGSLASIPVPDIDRCTYFLIIGANPLQSNGSLMTAPGVPRRLRAIQDKGGKIVVVDPRRTETAAMADWHLPIRPGADACLLFAIVRILFEDGLVRPRHIEGLAKGIDELRVLCQPFTPEVASEASGIEASDIRRLAHELFNAERACVYGRIGSSMQQFGSVTNWLIVVVNVLTGNLDREGGSMFPQGVFEAIFLNDRCTETEMPYGRWHSRVRELPELGGTLPAAGMAEEMDTPGHGQVKGLITMGGNPVIAFPNGGGRLTDALKNLEFMMCIDIYINETTKYADVVLPSPSRFTHSDFMIYFTILTVRDYLRWSPPIFDLPDGALHDWDIICRLVSRLEGITSQEAEGRALRGLYDQLKNQGNPVVASLSFEQVLQHLGTEGDQDRMFDLLVRSGPYGDHFGDRPGGLTLEAMKAMPHGVDFGAVKPRIENVIHFPDGKIDLAPPLIVSDILRLRDWMEHKEAEGLQLIGRRQVRSYNSWTHNFKSLAKGPELCCLLMNPIDAEERGIRDGTKVSVSSRTGQLVVDVGLSDEMRRGVVSIPHGWGHDDDDIPGQTRAKSRPGVNSNILADEMLMDVPSANVNLNGIQVVVKPH